MLLGKVAPKLAIVLGRGASSTVYNIFNEFFQTGKLGTDNIGLYAFDVITDMIFTVLTGVSILESFASYVVQSVVGRIVDGFADIFQTFLYLTPKHNKELEITFELRGTIYDNL